MNEQKLTELQQQVQQLTQQVHEQGEQLRAIKVLLEESGYKVGQLR